MTKHVPTSEETAALEAWLEGRPEVIQQTARAYPPWHCYRSTQNAQFHYRLKSYSENGTVTLVHGSDSTLPGLATFGQPPEQLIVCDCGEWKPPTAEQARATQERMRAFARRPGGAHYGCVDPQCPVCQLERAAGSS